ncbi:MAG TPA: DUF4838 domain-containing protein [Abditibacteriaceae bacterium]|jgi:hypothetical protein
MKPILLLAALSLPFFCVSVIAQPANSAGELIIVADGKTQSTIVVSPAAGQWEKQGAEDLAKYIERMAGARPALANASQSITTALQSQAPVFIVGEEALKADPSLRQALEKVAKKNPVLRADAIVARRRNNRIYLAGTNDESHYFAVSYLLQQWGCRWYLPTAFGECIPEQPTLKIRQLDYAYAPPFEVRHYWLSWNASSEGAEEFQKRNFMSSTKVAGMGHALAEYTKELVPPGKTHFNVPFAEEATAQHVAKKIAPEYAKGTGSISLAIEDGNYATDSPNDNALKAGLYDKYMLRDSLTDPMMVFYNNVARILREQHPNSKTKIGGMAYANVTLPPQRAFKPEPSLVMWLAPIDIDPNHGMDDPRSPPRQEYREMLYRWAQIMEGRLVIYDYDQGMLVWRDIPNPSQHVFQQDVKHYRQAGILGVGTESRGASATTFLNLFFRGQLMWNPDADVEAQLKEFYPKFYGPMAPSMQAYWDTIFKAWRDTAVTEHEHFAAPAIYTPQLINELRKHLDAAYATLQHGEDRLGEAPRDWKLYQERMRFTRMSFDILSNFVAMEQAAATQADYKAAVQFGERALAERERLTAMNGTFTTYKNIGENGPAWWPGQVQQYRELSELTDGTKGTLIAKTPLEWAFRRDPSDSGIAAGWAYKTPDLSYWKTNSARYNGEARKDYPAHWEMLRTDLYMQAQGVLHPDGQSFTGYAWYSTNVEIAPQDAKGKIHLRFPGLFNECWLYVNGNLVAHREQNPIWWLNDYKFEWDVDLSNQLKAGPNQITLRLHNPHHFGGIFRRPFFYRRLG